MTQWINRLHPAVKARIERKNTFQKLTVVGRKSNYRVTFFHTTSPGKLEKVGGQTLKYDPAIFPLYDGYAPGSENPEVYEEGGKTVWAAMAVRGFIFITLGCIGVYFFIEDSPAQPSAAVTHGASTGAQHAGLGQGAGSSRGGDPVAPAPKADPYADLTAEQRYVVELGEKGRIRLAMLAQVGGEDRAWVQWISIDGNEVMEQLDARQLRALGYAVTVESYGVRLSAGKHVMVATAWPYRMPVREKDARLYNMSGDDAGAGPASVASGGGAGVVTRGSTGGSLICVASRPMATFPESPQNRYSGQ